MRKHAEYNKIEENMKWMIHSKTLQIKFVINSLHNKHITIRFIKRIKYQNLNSN